MRVVQGWRSDPERELTDPLPEKKWSVVLRFVGGDWLDPISVGSNWFHPPYPKHVLHVWWPLWLSYVLFAGTSGLLMASLALGPWWSWPFAFLIWLLTPGKMIAWRFNKKGGYAGHKVYGVDAPEYPLWLCTAGDVFPGSLALCWSIRPFATISS